MEMLVDGLRLATLLLLLLEMDTPRDEVLEFEMQLVLDIRLQALKLLLFPNAG